MELNATIHHEHLNGPEIDRVLKICLLTNLIRRDMVLKNEL